MKRWIVAAAMASLVSAGPASAQFGVLDKGLKKAQQAKEAKDKFDDLNVTEEEERTIGEDVSAKVRARFGVERVAIVHRTGEVPLGEVSIAVVAVSPHRDAAFEAARYGIDETKARAPIWKAERFRDGHVWIGEAARTGPEEGS